MVTIHYVFEYHRSGLQRGGETGLKIVQTTWAKAQNLSPSKLAPSNWRKQADRAPPGSFLLPKRAALLQREGLT